MNLKRATHNDTSALLPLMRAYHDFEGIIATEPQRLEVVRPLLGEQSNFGQIWLIQAANETVGYIAICFGYSIEFGGRDAFVDELFITEAARGRGLGGMALEAIKGEAKSAGVRVLHLEVARTNAAAKKFYLRHGFISRARFHLMSCRLGQ